MTKALAKVKTGGKLAKGGDTRAMLAAMAKEDAARDPGGGTGNYISIKGKNFTYRGDGLPEPLNVIALDYAFENAFYLDDYDEENPQPPACFAIGKVEDDMVPHESSPEPQAESCADCPHNKFGTADRGRGKACKNNRRIAMISAEVKKLDVSAVKESEIAMMRIPPSSVKFFKGYLRKLSETLSLPLCGVVSSLAFDEDKAHPVVQFSASSELPNDKTLIKSILDKRGDAQEPLLVPINVSNFGQKQSKASLKKPAKSKKRF